MKRLLTINEESFGRKKLPNITIYRKREATRAVLLTQKDEVYLINVTSLKYHKLPGGGINKDEDKKDALVREILEEVGCNSQIGPEIGEILEYRYYTDESLEQYSYCYLAKQVNERGKQNLEQGEIEIGHDLVIAASIDEAIEILENDTPDSNDGEYIRLRDLTILKEAKKLLT